MNGRRGWWAAWLLALSAITAGCTERDRSDGSLTAACDASMPATGEEQRVAHPTQPSQCRFGVMFCNACVYDANGGLSHSVSEPCGVCLGTKF